MNRTAMISFSSLAAITLGVASANADVVNLVQNGSFEDSPFQSRWQLFEEIPGWKPLNGVKIELQRDVRSWDAKDGDYYAELDSHGPGVGPLGVYQDISTLQGQAYDLSVWFSPRPGVASNTLEVLWDGEVVGTSDADGRGMNNTEWRQLQFTVTADTDLSRLEFRLGDERDTLGTFIDDVSLTTVVPAPGAMGLLGVAGAMLTRRRR